MQILAEEKSHTGHRWGWGGTWHSTICGMRLILPGNNKPDIAEAQRTQKLKKKEACDDQGRWLALYTSSHPGTPNYDVLWHAQVTQATPQERARRTCGHGIWVGLMPSCCPRPRDTHSYASYDRSTNKLITVDSDYWFTDERRGVGRGSWSLTV